MPALLWRRKFFERLKGTLAVKCPPRAVVILDHPLDRRGDNFAIARQNSAGHGSVEPFPMPLLRSFVVFRATHRRIALVGRAPHQIEPLRKGREPSLDWLRSWMERQSAGDAELFDAVLPKERLHPLAEFLTLKRPLHFLEVLAIVPIEVFRQSVIRKRQAQRRA